MGGMLGDHPRRHWQGGCGGGCCNSRADDRSAKKAVKQSEQRELNLLVDEETSLTDWDRGYDDGWYGRRVDLDGSAAYKDGYLVGAGEDYSYDGSMGEFNEAPFTTETPR